MKNLYALSALFLISNAAWGSTQDTVLLDSIAIFSVQLQEGEIDSDTSASAVEHFQFDDEHRLIERTEYTKDEQGSITPSKRTQIEYTSNGSVRTESEYEDGEWVPDERISIVSTDSLFQRITDRWEVAFEDWFGYQRTIRRFGEYGLIYYSFDFWRGDKWTPSFVTHTTYDELGRADALEIIDAQRTRKRFYSYLDTTSLRLGDTTYLVMGEDLEYHEATYLNFLPGTELNSNFARFEFDHASSTWDTVTLFEYEFDAMGNQVERRWYDFTSQGRRLINIGFSDYLRGSLRSVYDEYSRDDRIDSLIRTLLVVDEFDDQDRLVKKTWQRWIDGEFRLGYEVLNSYLEEGQRSFYQYRPYTTETELESSYDFDIYHYGEVLALVIFNPIQIAPASVFPNPASHAIQVAGSTDDLGYYKWYDLTGRLLVHANYDGLEIQLPNDSNHSPLILILSDKNGKDIQVVRVLRH